MSSRFKIKPWVLLLLICLFLVLAWFPSGFIRGGGEEGIAFYSPLRTYQLTKVMWWDYAGGFPTLAWLPHYNLFLLLNFIADTLHLSNTLLQAGTLFSLLVVGSVSTYFLTRDFIIKNDQLRLVPFLTALFYIFNPYSMSQVWGRGLTPQYFTFALLPLSILLFLRGLMQKKYIYLFYLTLASIVFSSAFGISTFIIVYWVILGLLWIYWFFSIKKKTKGIIFFAFSYFFTALLLWVVGNAHWFLPTALEGGKIYAANLTNPRENIDTLIGVSRNYTPFVLVRLLQDTYFSAVSPFSALYAKPIFQILSFILPFFVCIGFFAIFKKKELTRFKFFIILFLVGIIVSSGANPPFGWLFIWIFEHITFLQAFRNPYEKFGIVYAFAYSPIFVIGLLHFFNHIFKQSKKSFIGIAAILIVSCGMFLWPMWIGKLMAGSILSVPSSYRALNNWINEQNDSYRLALVPFWSGDGAFYKWGETQYQGLDPAIYQIDKGTISNNPSNFVFYSNFMRLIRQKIYQEDVSGALSLFRIKYVVDRGDAVNISTTEKLHGKFLTDTIYQPNNLEDLNQVICEDKVASSSGVASPAWVICDLPEKERDLSRARYLHVVTKVDMPANFDLAVKDISGNRPNWYGMIQDEYHLPAKEWTEIIIPLGVPTAINNATDFSKITSVDIRAHPLGKHSESVGKIEIKGIWLDSGIEKKVNNFQYVKTFGKLKVYQAKNLNTPPEFGVLDSLEVVNNLDELITKSHEKHQEIDFHGFLVDFQNKEKKLDYLRPERKLQIEKAKKISETRYWMKVKKPEKGFLILSKTFNSQWKAIPGITEKELHGGFFENINILKKSFLLEKNHYVVNGYANLWRINGQSDTYAVIFLPQLYADIGRDITLVSTIFISLFMVGYFMSRKFRK